jgi:CheY-like chemotaxis protein
MVDGVESTRLIRAFEKHNSIPTRPKGKYGRTPIFALSSGLHQDDEDRYIDRQFDGWAPKPFNHARLALFFAGLLNMEKRIEGVYERGKFTNGGWFERVISGIMPMMSE